MTKVKLFVNEKEIPLKHIMQSIISNIINGFVMALNDVPEERNNIKIEIEAKN